MPQRNAALGHTIPYSIAAKYHSSRCIEAMASSWQVGK
jgi:hypothetical protein